MFWPCHRGAMGQAVRLLGEYGLRFGVRLSDDCYRSLVVWAKGAVKAQPQAMAPTIFINCIYFRVTDDENQNLLGQALWQIDGDSPLVRWLWILDRSINRHSR